MAVQDATTNPSTFSPLTVEEEDHIILTRITNDERPLRRVIKKFHNYTSFTRSPLVPPVTGQAGGSNTLEDAREAFLIELATFELQLKKCTMICEAEARQVEEYQKERQHIEDEHGKLKGQIEQLKTSLEHAQIQRKRKIEYDAIAEKINTLPSREELEKAIDDLDNDMTAILAEHETQEKTIQSQKSALDSIISELTSLKFAGREMDTSNSVITTPRMTPAPDNVPVDGGDNAVDVDRTGPWDKRLNEEKGEDEKMPPASEKVSTGSTNTEKDIEMGEVEEMPKETKTRKKTREDLEEGEASDESSVLSDPPDDL